MTDEIKRETVIEDRTETVKEGDSNTIENLYVFVAKATPTTREAIIAVPTQRGVSPLLTDKEDQLEAMRSVAQEAANGMKRDVSLVRLTRAEVVEEIAHKTIATPDAGVVLPAPHLVKNLVN